jgi:hypothetical protein
MRNYIIIFLLYNIIYILLSNFLFNGCCYYLEHEQEIKRKEQVTKGFCPGKQERGEGGGVAFRSHNRGLARLKRHSQTQKEGRLKPKQNMIYSTVHL